MNSTSTPFDQETGEPNSKKGARVELPLTSALDYAQNNVYMAQRTIARAEGNVGSAQQTADRAQEAVDRANHLVRQEELKVTCLGWSHAIKRNLLADEYESLLKGVEVHTAFFIKSATTTDPFNLEEVERKLEIAKEEVGKAADQKLKAAKEELKAAKEELDKAKQELKAAKEELDKAKQELETAEQKQKDAKQAAGTGTPFGFELDPTLASKERIASGDGVKLLGELYGRENAQAQIKKGYAALARQRGVSPGDKKLIPIIACASQSGTGKTEFLRHVLNKHGHYGDGVGNQLADEVVQLINNNSPAGTKPLEKIITLFCSFNQNSTFEPIEEPIIVETATERLLRSYHGIAGFQYNPEMNLKVRFASLLDQIPVEVGVIVCIDEIAKLSNTARTTLLDHLMTSCQNRISVGGFCAVVATAMTFRSWGTAIYTVSNRVVHPYTLLPGADDVELLEAITNKLTSMMNNLAGGNKDNIEIAARILSQAPKPEHWVDYLSGLAAPGRHQFHLPSMKTIGAIDTDESMIFEWLAPDILKCAPVSLKYKGNELLTEKVQELYGDYITTNGLSANDLKGDVKLPAVRFLQIELKADNKYVCLWMQNAIVDCATASRKDIAKAWELGVIALMEVWRAAARAVSSDNQKATLGSLPIFSQAFPKKDCIVCHIKDKLVLGTPLPDEPLSLPKNEGALGVWYSEKSNEAYIEATVRYNDQVCMLIQNKLHADLKKETFIDAMVKLGKKEAQLLQKTGTSTTYVSVLIVTGATPDLVKTWIKDSKSVGWPRNYVVVTKGAVEALVKPFGAGMLASILSQNLK